MAEVIKEDFPDPELARDARVATAASLLGELADLTVRTSAYMSGLSPEEQERALRIAVRLSEDTFDEELLTEAELDERHERSREALMEQLLDYQPQPGHEPPHPSPAEAEQIAARFIEQERIRKGII